MTEDEAREKWCPMVRIADCGAENATAVNREYESTSPTTLCIASDCMMWIKYEEIPRVVDGVNVIDTVGGCCGLAR